MTTKINEPKLKSMIAAAFQEALDLPKNPYAYAKAEEVVEKVWPMINRQILAAIKEAE